MRSWGQKLANPNCICMNVRPFCADVKRFQSSRHTPHTMAKTALNNASATVQASKPARFCKAAAHLNTSLFNNKGPTLSTGTSKPRQQRHTLA